MIKQKVFTLVTLFCLFIATCPLSGYSAGPDGFANVPWGASMSQIDQIMTKQGFNSGGQIIGKSYNDGSNGIWYRGSLIGVAGNLDFWFLGGTFFRGNFNFYSEDGGSAVLEAYRKFLSVIKSKYGSPTESGSTYNVWRGLQAPGSSDKIQIVFIIDTSSERCGGGYCTSSLNVSYTNESLQQRLAVRNKDGL